MFEDDNIENQEKKELNKFAELFLRPRFLNQYNVYEDYSELIDGVFYYQDQQIDIRMTCIKILIGTIAISGGLSFYNIGLSSFLLTLTGSLLPLLAIFLITVSLFHDLVYKEGLKLGFFSEAGRYENMHSWILPFHKCLVTETNIHKVKGTTQISFYFGCVGILFLISALSLSIQFVALHNRLLILFSFFIFYIIYIFLIIKLLKHPRDSLTELLKEASPTPEPIPAPLAEYFSSLMHIKGKDYIEHFSSIKMRYKRFSITILGALLLALSYIAGFSDNIIHIDKINFISILIIISVIGLNIIRYLDVNVSHEQIRMLFKTVIELETKEKALPKPYSLMSEHLYSKKFDPVIVDFFYYSSLAVGIIIFGLILLIGMIQPHHPKLNIIFSVSLLVIFFLKEIFSFIYTYKKRLKFNKSN